MLFEKHEAYLIDTENVGSTWVNLLSATKRMDLYIFATENAKNLNFSLLHEITENKNRNNYKILDCQTGKNSLDFQLASYLGYLIGKNAHSSYTVVSEDKGFDNVISFWKNKGFNVSRLDPKPEKKKIIKPKEETVKPKKKAAKVKTVTENKEVTEKKKAPAKKKINGKNDLLKSKLIDYSDEDILKIKGILDGVESHGSNDVYVALVKELKQEKGLTTYNLLKKSLNRYYTLSD